MKKQNLIIVLLVILFSTGNTFISAKNVTNGKYIFVKSAPTENFFKPLDEITLNVSNFEKRFIAVWDSKGDEYFRAPASASNTFRVGGALGHHTICLFDKKGVIVDKAGFDVNCRTEILDDKAYYGKALKMLYNTMVCGSDKGGEVEIVRIDGKYYTYFVRWLRDHVHTMKGMKYFYKGDIKSGIDLYSDYQREDGMIFDNIMPRRNKPNYWDVRFSYGDFIKPVDNGNYEFKRIPVEADVEYLFIEGIYYTWKASGDDVWMAGLLDNALKALNYSTTNPYRWSDKYQLLKRGYTIDTWDFQNSEDAKISVGPDNDPDPMVIKPEYTRFNIMHGDNTGLAAGCRYLAEMLNYVGRREEASKVAAKGKQIMENLNRISWNGNFYTHQVPENTTIVRDLGVDEKSQVSLSNSYDLNRGIDHEKAVQILKTYQRIRQEMPKSSPGEFYGIYPPFTKGFGGHASEWEYVNGGVTAMVAGELAHGAFDNGYEKYGVDIINRMYEFSKNTGEYLHDTYRGSMPDEPVRNFTAVDLKPYSNVDINGVIKTKGVVNWTGEGNNDFSACPVGKQVFENIPFEIIDPSENGRKACIGLSGANNYKLSTVIPINKKAASIYLLHTLCNSRGSNTTTAGILTINYTDNSSYENVIDNQKIGQWWFPYGSSEKPERNSNQAKIAFTFPNAKSPSVGGYLYGFNNPNPEKTIQSIELKSIKNESKWMVLGMTLSDYPVYYSPDIVSGGMPANWCAAAVVYAMVEGLAGVKDVGVGFNKVAFSPRWAASEVKNVSSTIKYEASNGYVSYKYSLTPTAIEIIYTGNNENTEARILLPDHKKIKSVTINGLPVSFNTVQVEQSGYAVFNILTKGVSNIKCDLINNQYLNRIGK